ncbi:hypothetical protein FDUTEX481_09221 [Tolypothrix sp. PCC 7601]|nr:hypothetical protein FDUTEX481_09221 [Tolypothrix sp. PCC 7601]
MTVPTSRYSLEICSEHGCTFTEEIIQNPKFKISNWDGQYQRWNEGNNLTPNDQ